MRPVTIFTGQWADLTFEQMCKTASEMGYVGLELATWGNHIDPKKAAEDDGYVRQIKDTMKKYNLQTWAISCHLCGQLVGDVYDKRHNGFAPSSVSDKPEAMRQWAIQEVKYIIKAAENFGIKVITGFTGSPIWNYWYSFPQTTQEMIEEGYQTIVERWSPLFDEMDKKGIVFALEVHPTEIAYDYYTFVKLLEAFDNRKTLGMNFDPSHFFWQGIDPIRALRALEGAIHHVHAKDTGIDATNTSINGALDTKHYGDEKNRAWIFRTVGYGHGEDFWRDFVSTLRLCGYDGTLSMEHEDSLMSPSEGLRKGVEFLREIVIREPKGAVTWA